MIMKHINIPDHPQLTAIIQPRTINAEKIRNNSLKWMEKDRDGWYDDFFGRMGKGAAKAAHPEWGM